MGDCAETKSLGIGQIVVLNFEVSFLWIYINRIQKTFQVCLDWSESKNTQNFNKLIFDHNDLKFQATKALIMSIFGLKINFRRIQA